MFLYLRIVFSILSALFVAAIAPVGALLSLPWAGACLLGAFFFFGLTLLCKQRQEWEEASTKTEQTDNKNTQADQ